jgi:alcohol oxidase
MGQASRKTKLSSARFIFVIFTRYIDLETGRRSDTAHYYIYNQDHNTNLKILVRHRVVRVIFEYVFNPLVVEYSHLMIVIRGTRAVGIEYVDDTIGRAKGTTEPIVARASRLVVLSAGALGSPSVLERSGIGANDVLKRNNVQQLVDLPGVGEHYMGLHHWIFQRK